MATNPNATPTVTTPPATAATPPSTAGGIVVAILTWVTGNVLSALSALPPDSQNQLAALGGIFFANMLGPIAERIFNDLFAKKNTVEDAQPSVTPDVQSRIDASVAGV